MVLAVYNSLTEKLEEFKPLEGKKVKMYVCGVTVYDYAHIGHARTYVAFDVIKRYLKYRGYDVYHVQNITDVDDKIIARANELGISPIELASRFALEAEKDLNALGIEKADIYPRVTDHVPEIIKFIQTLIKKGYAYQANGDVYFSVKKFLGYGDLSHQSIHEVLSGARVEIDEKKKDPVDFSLWKNSKKGELSFESPWGRGRPGWHIECSTMSTKYLGDRFDIHGGAKDLIFPHHENEIAQSEAATGKKPFVKYWLHTGFLNAGGEKMSKSLGNFVTIRDLLQECDADAFRLFILSAHYRSPIDFEKKILEQAKRNLTRVTSVVQGLEKQVEELSNEKQGEDVSSYEHGAAEIERRYIEAMDNDFNTPEAVVAFQDLVKLGNKALTSGADKSSLTLILETLRRLSLVFGLSSIGAEVEKTETELPDEARKLIEEREEARKKKNWKKSDDIRAQLGKMGIVIEDTAKGTSWKYADTSPEK
ncbi:MAG: cysteine--tRNA ligase [Candidatus Atabeyarchaeum deiterrae]